MKILLVSGPGISLKEPYNSGIESFLVTLANQLIDDGHQVDVVAHDADFAVKFTLIDPFKKSYAIFPGFVKRFKESLQFKTLDINSYDVVHYNMFYPHVLMAGRKFNKPFFLTLHSQADSKRVALYKKLFRKSDVTFVAISERVKDQWTGALEIDMPTIVNGINLDIWSSNNSENRIYLLWAARINKEKNVTAAINLAKKMRLPLKIAGRIIDQDYFDKKVKPHLNDQIRYVGHITQTELSVLAKNALAYLATATWQEPFGLAALEMLASGVPVVGFNSAVPPDWIHESVLTTNSNDWEDLQALVERSKAVDSESCKEFASQMNIQKMASQYVALYKEILERNTRVENRAIENEGSVQAALQQNDVSNPS